MTTLPRSHGTRWRSWLPCRLVSLRPQRPLPPPQRPLLPGVARPASGPDKRGQRQSLLVPPPTFPGSRRPPLLKNNSSRPFSFFFCSSLPPQTATRLRLSAL
ncbi:hypothetical protein PAPYR_6848 [Paratrimastix pyriformis]|uniref:Uncharacterized protein n=1 Tax=Paratrimastix pyriformis TaxID=342808 RepID=A0ABQ8UI69_9EUKA|nr:hypothetical protein PAPYR_6848 [Paratrimastix pyriformis]